MTELQDLLKWIEVQMQDCESKDDNWVVTGQTITAHVYPVKTQVTISKSSYPDHLLCKAVLYDFYQDIHKCYKMSRILLNN